LGLARGGGSLPRNWTYPPDVKGDHLFVGTAGQEQLRLRPPAKHADRPVGRQGPQIPAVGRQQVDPLAFGRSHLRWLGAEDFEIHDGGRHLHGSLRVPGRSGRPRCAGVGPPQRRALRSRSVKLLAQVFAVSCQGRRVRHGSLDPVTPGRDVVRHETLVVPALFTLERKRPLLECRSSGGGETELDWPRGLGIQVDGPCTEVPIEIDRPLRRAERSHPGGRVARHVIACQDDQGRIRRGPLPL